MNKGKECIPIVFTIEITECMSETLRSSGQSSCLQTGDVLGFL
jgi:hypothetical protein